MMIAALPRLFREQTHTQSGKKLLKLSLLLALGYGLLAAAALWLFAPVITWLFGNEFAGITETLHWLALAVPGLTVRSTIGALLVTQAKPWARVVFEVIGVAILICAAIYLVSVKINYAIPIALAIAEWSMAMIGWIIINRAKTNY